MITPASNNAANLSRDTMPAVRKASDDMLRTASHAVDSTRDYANSALHHTQQHALAGINTQKSDEKIVSSLLQRTAHPTDNSARPQPMMDNLRSY